MTGNELVVDLATDATGALSSTAAQVVTAINAHAAAAAQAEGLPLPRVRGRGHRHRPGDAALAAVGLAERARARPARAVPGEDAAHRRQRDGSKVGVFIYCQQHAREWVTPITCLETAERLLRNYAIDPQTKELLDNLDVFIVPSVNPDGSHYSLYDNNNQRRNLVNHCLPDTFQDPLARDFIGRRPQPQQHASARPSTATSARPP